MPKLETLRIKYATHPDNNNNGNAAEAAATTAAEKHKTGRQWGIEPVCTKQASLNGKFQSKAPKSRICFPRAHATLSYALAHCSCVCVLERKTFH